LTLDLRRKRERWEEDRLLNVRLNSDEARADSRRVRCGEGDDEILQMSKRSRKTTLGDLQGDQSEVRLR
jgi:hypothetical protein